MDGNIERKLQGSVKNAYLIICNSEFGGVKWSTIQSYNQLLEIVAIAWTLIIILCVMRKVQCWGVNFTYRSFELLIVLFLI